MQTMCRTSEDPSSCRDDQGHFEDDRCLFASWLGRRADYAVYSDTVIQLCYLLFHGLVRWSLVDTVYGLPDG